MKREAFVIRDYGDNRLIVPYDGYFASTEKVIIVLGDKRIEITNDGMTVVRIIDKKRKVPDVKVIPNKNNVCLYV